MGAKFTRLQAQKIISEAGFTERNAADLAGKIFGAMAQALIDGGSVEIRGFGSLEAKERKAYTAHNPRSREAVSVPPRRRILFHPGRALKAALRKQAQGGTEKEGAWDS